MRLGDTHPVYGRLVALHWSGGERSYLFDSGKCITLMPAGALRSED